MPLQNKLTRFGFAAGADLFPGTVSYIIFMDSDYTYVCLTLLTPHPILLLARFVRHPLPLSLPLSLKLVFKSSISFLLYENAYFYH